MKEENAISFLLRDHYSLVVEDIKQLAGEQDLNFHISNSNDEYIVKLMHTTCDIAQIKQQADILDYLEKQNLDLHLPQVIRTNDKKNLALVKYENEDRILWVLSFCPGLIYAHAQPRTKELHHSLGSSLGKLNLALSDYTPNGNITTHRWELTNALDSKDFCQHISDDSRSICEQVFKKFETQILHAIKSLPHSIIHNDANDYNLLVVPTASGFKLSGIFDFGDMAYQPTICDSAIALAYAIMGQEDPLAVCYQYLQGFHSLSKISEDELAVLFDLIKTRLAVSIAISSKRQIEQTENSYLSISQKPAKKALQKLNEISDDFALAVFRSACNYPIHSGISSIKKHLETTAAAAIIANLKKDCILDLSVNSSMIGALPENVLAQNLELIINAEMERNNTSMSIGRYNEARMIYLGELFGASNYPASTRRRIHMGLDVFCAVNTPVNAPYDALVYKMSFNPTPLDYGQLIILEHRTEQNFPFYTLYGHLAENSKDLVKEGQQIKAGQHFANIGAFKENGNWPPHLHLQVMTHMLGLDADFPGVVYANEREYWKELCPNPALLIDPDNYESYDAEINNDQLIVKRSKMMAKNLSLSYKQSMHIVHGYKQFLYDNNAQGYLDMYNNVPHVGHSHPKVIEAVQKQIALLNTNTRYLHENILRYSEKLLALFPESLDVCYLVNSASEANELALRLARTFTGRKDILVNENAYHGHTSTLIEISPYKHNGPGGTGPPPWLHTADAPDDYRGKYKRNNPNCGKLFADDLSKLIENKKIAAYISETYQSVGGQLIPPQNYLNLSYQYVKENGGLNIADEVQTGFGRLGSHWWGFEAQNAVADIVVLGKPIANGMPMGAVVTTREIADSFDNGMEFFSTFGGNPVSCAAAEAMLDVILEEGLMQNAQILGEILKSRFLDLKNNYPIIGDVRAQGFFLGIELIRNHDTLEPAAEEATYIVNRLKENFILAGVDGPLHNVLKFRPIMACTKTDIDHLCSELDKIFSETRLQFPFY